MCKKFRIPVSWSVCAYMEIEAENLQEAIEIAMDAPLPVDGEYIDSSFEYVEAFVEANSDYYGEKGIV